LRKDRTKEVLSDEAKLRACATEGRYLEFGVLNSLIRVGVLRYVSNDRKSKTNYWRISNNNWWT